MDKLLVRACKINPWERQKEVEKILTKSFLFKEYIINHKSPVAIAHQILCGSTTIKNYLQKYNIHLRTASESAKIGCEFRTSTIYFRISKKLIFIKKEYLINFRAIHTIAKMLHVSYNMLRNYMILKNILIRNKTECQLGELNHSYGQYGKLNSNWQGGISFGLYPLGWTKTFKEQIRYRDGYKCQNLECGVSEVECRRKLDVHHIDYDKENLNPKNLITLCMKCHRKTNGNRDYYYAYFTYIMEHFLK